MHRVRIQGSLNLCGHRQEQYVSQCIHPRCHWDSTGKWKWKEIREEIRVHLRALVCAKWLPIPSGARSRPAGQYLTASCGPTLEPRDKEIYTLSEGNAQGNCTLRFKYFHFVSPPTSSLTLRRRKGSVNVRSKSFKICSNVTTIINT